MTKLFFDIGCNRGEFYTTCFSKYPGCKVVAVDANETLITSSRGRDNLTLINKAVSKQRSDVDFFIDPVQTGISTASKKYLTESRFAKGSANLPKASGHWRSPVKVSTVTLDSLIEEYGTPYYIKVDVEGYEYEVISSLSSPVGMVAFEWHEEDLETAHQCCEHLSSIGFTKFGVTAYHPSGDVSTKITYDENGDSYLLFPSNYYDKQEVLEALESYTVEGRRIAYGMITATDALWKNDNIESLPECPPLIY